MQIIDELEMSKRGPYGGGIGHVSFTGGMDMALALRTMVIPTTATDTFYEYGPDKSRREWVVHLQAGAGLVADSVRSRVPLHNAKAHKPNFLTCPLLQSSRMLFNFPLDGCK
jgi:hypothetical protein